MNIVTASLELVPATLEIVRADLHRRGELPGTIHATIGTGWPPPLIDVAAMERIKAALEQDPDPDGWTARYVVLRTSRTLIGLGGFKSRPVNGAVEIGYSLLPAYQGMGFGTEFVEGLVRWAFAQPGTEVVFAETLPELVGSQRVLLKNGFIRKEPASEPGVIRFERRRDG